MTLLEKSTKTDLMMIADGNVGAGWSSQLFLEIKGNQKPMMVIGLIEIVLKLC